MQIAVQFLNGREDIISVKPTYTLTEVKQCIAHRCGIINHMRLVYGGRTMADQKTLADYNVQHGDKLYLVFYLRGGGNDGGSIPTRSEMVRLKRIVKRTDPAQLKQARWITCAITKQRLQQRVVVDDLGNLFNKESVLKCLIDKSMPLRFSHIRSTKNVYDVFFSTNQKYDPLQQVQVGMESLDSPFECMITGLPVNGQHTFSVIKSCGHVFSDRGLLKTESANLSCFVCQKPLKPSDILQINPDEKIQDMLRSKLSLEQKSKKKTRRKRGRPGKTNKGRIPGN